MSARRVLIVMPGECLLDEGVRPLHDGLLWAH